MVHNRRFPARLPWFLGAGLVVTSGCVTVSPAQRQHLAKPEMNPETKGHEEYFYLHVEAAREGGMGGHGVAGGGCGCG